jgi:hypothetical protein
MVIHQYTHIEIPKIVSFHVLTLDMIFFFQDEAQPHFHLCNRSSGYRPEQDREEAYIKRKKPRIPHFRHDIQGSNYIILGCVRLSCICKTDE